MILANFVIGAVFFSLGWIYFYAPNLVLYLNKIARELLFNDRLILLERRKLAILFFCLSFITLFMGFSSLTQLRIHKMEETTKSKIIWQTLARKYPYDKVIREQLRKTGL